MSLILPLPLTYSFALGAFVISTVLMLASLHRPLRALGIFIVFRPLLQPAATLGYSLGPVSLGPVLSLLLILVAVVNCLSKGKGKFFFKEVTALYLMVLASLPALLVTPSVSISIAFYVRVFSGIAAFLIVVNNVRNSDNLLYILKAFALSSIIPMIFGFYQYATGTGHMYASEFYAGKRIDSVFMYFNAYGEYLAIMICLLLMRYVNKDWKKPGLLTHGLFFCVILSFLFALNRGSWLSLAFGLLAAVFYYRGVIKLHWLILAGVLVAVFAGGMIMERFDDLDVVNTMGYSRNTFQGRVDSWAYSLELLGRQPLTGIGPGASAIVSELHFGEGYDPHNDYMRVLIESGPIGFICYAFFIVVNLGAHVRLRKLQSVRFINFSMFAFVLYYAIISFFQNIITTATIFPLVLICLGIARASVNIAASIESEQNNKAEEGV